MSFDFEILYLDTKTGDYRLGETDLGDYLELKFLNIEKSGKLICIASYDVEIIFSAIHNEQNTVRVTFVTSSIAVNRHIRMNWETELHDKVATFSIQHMKMSRWEWFWPKINGKQIGKGMYAV